MSVFNDAQFVGESIQSILNQSYTNFDFLIIDDGSEDKSREIIKKWKDKDSRIRTIFHDKNKGLGYSLNEGVENANSKWIARMDADDIAMPERFEQQLQFMEQNPEIDILSSWAIEIDKNGNHIRTRQVPEAHEEIVDLLWAIPVIHPAVMFRKSAILKSGSYSVELKRRQDYELWFRCAQNGCIFANIQEPLIYYRFSENFFKKNDLSVAVQQLKIGFHGCRMINAPFKAYIGITVPFVRTLLPNKINEYFQRIINKFDPRKQSNN